MAKAKKNEFPTPKEEAIQAVYDLFEDGQIDEFDRDVRLGYLESKDDDWAPGSSAAVDAHHRRREAIERENRASQQSPYQFPQDDPNYVIEGEAHE